MISLIYVATSQSEVISKALVDSILKRTFLIDEIICVLVDKTTTERYAKNGIEIIKLGIGDKIGHHTGHQRPWPIRASEMGAGLQHPFGLHCGLEIAKNEKVFFCDSDVFFYTNIESIFLKYLNDGFQFVGLAHHNQQRADGNFPTVISLLTEKKYLPDENYLKENRSIIETFFAPILDDANRNFEFPYRDKFPYGNEEYQAGHKKILDTGSMIYPWCQEKNMNWLSFLTRDCKHYNSKHIMASKPYERIGTRNLAFHLCGGSFDGKSFGKEFCEYRQNLWQENKNLISNEYQNSERQYNESSDVFVY